MNKIIKINILSALLVSNGIFAWLYFSQEECTLDRFAVKIPTTVSSFSTTTPPIINKVSHDTYVKKDGKVYYSTLFKRHTESPNLIEIKNVDFDTFEVIGTNTLKEEFAKDKTSVFLAGEKIDVDTSSFQEIGDFYFKDKDYIYRASRNSSEYYFFKKVDCDVDSFKVFVKDNYGDYSFDKNSVYYNGERINDIDPNTFKFVLTPKEISGMGGKGGSRMTKFYMKDSSHVIYEGKIISGADTDSFSTIYTGGYFQEYGKDKSRVYYLNLVVDGADPETFVPQSQQIYEGCRKGLYGIDSKSVYFKNFKIIGADPNTFETLINGYGKDKNNVYFEGVIQDDIDTKEFQPVCNYG